MNPYDPNAKCPKCGGEDVASAFREFVIQGNGTSPTTIGVAKENILRTCRRCHFSWPELPLDARSPDSGEMEWPDQTTVERVDAVKGVTSVRPPFRYEAEDDTSDCTPSGDEACRGSRKQMRGTSADKLPKLPDVYCRTTTIDPHIVLRCGEGRT